MKKLLIALSALLSVEVFAANRGDFHGSDFESIKKEYAGQMKVSEKQYMVNQAQSLITSLANQKIDPALARRRYIDSVYTKADSYYLFMGFPWEISKNAVYRVVMGNDKGQLTTDPKTIAKYNTHAQDPSDWGQWIAQKYVESFSYHDNLVKLLSGVSRLEQGICTGASDAEDTFTDATEIVGGVSLWVLATAGCVPVDPSFGIITLFVCQPAGYIVGSVIGLKVGELVYEQKCGGSHADSTETLAELNEFVQYQ